MHHLYRIGETISVINKADPKPQEAFLMILDNVHETVGRGTRDAGPV
jgi:hypothetical protein